MDNKTPERDALARPLKPARVALNVLALCFVLALVGRGLGDELYGFPQTDRGEFRLGPRRGGLGLFTDLAGGRADGAGGRPAVRPLRPPHRLFAGTAAARRRVSCSLAGAGAVAIPGERRALPSGSASPSSATCRIRSCSAAGSAHACRRRWQWFIPRPARACWCCCRPRKS